MAISTVNGCNNIVLKFNVERIVWVIFNPIESANSSIAIECFDVLHVLFSQFEIGTVQIINDAFFGNRFWNDYYTTLRLAEQKANSFRYNTNDICLSKYLKAQNDLYWRTVVLLSQFLQFWVLKNDGVFWFGPWSVR